MDTDYRREFYARFMSLMLFFLMVTTAELSYARIIDGEPAEPGRYPYFTGIFLKNDQGVDTFFCGGTLIADNAVLTAAHCLPGAIGDDTSNIQQYSVRVGLSYLGDGSEDDMEYVASAAVSHVFSPEGVNFWPIATAYKDIAIVFLDRRVRDVEPINIRHAASRDARFIPNLAAGTDVVMIGFGELTEGELDRPEALMQANLQVQPLEACSPEDEEIIDRYNGYSVWYCTSARDGGLPSRGSLGDSGGPLIFVDPESGEDIIIGITHDGYSLDPDLTITRFVNLFRWDGWMSGVGIKPFIPTK
ncbi:Trypsin [BD1-7 clade bacterium]|uniref:Trypsin n=1 Tax=BD1-7 clade bacterium TaxID=2029982 RepID=A0A5S9PPG6_9GAMM|nr:Trypsin [BD1-7 clade bacterium]